jgi:hypothetical protein
MSRTRVTREVALQALGGGTPVQDLLRCGLQSFGGVRHRVGESVWPDRKIDRRRGRHRGPFVYARLRFGARLRLYLNPLDPPGEIIAKTNEVVERPRGMKHHDWLVYELNRRVGRNAAAMVRVALSIERARQACISQLEVQTRWL